MLLVNIETRPKKLLLILRSSCKMSSGIYIDIVIGVLHFLGFTFVNRNIAANMQCKYLFTPRIRQCRYQSCLYVTPTLQDQLYQYCVNNPGYYQKYETSVEFVQQFGRKQLNK